MKGLKAVLGIALSVSGLGTAVALGTASVTPTNEMIQAEAANSSWGIVGTRQNPTWQPGSKVLLTAAPSGSWYEAYGTFHFSQNEEFKLMTGNSWDGSDIGKDNVKFGNATSKFGSNGTNIKCTTAGDYDIAVAKNQPDNSYYIGLFTAGTLNDTNYIYVLEKPNDNGYWAPNYIYSFGGAAQFGSWGGKTYSSLSEYHASATVNFNGQYGNIYRLPYHPVDTTFIIHNNSGYQSTNTSFVAGAAYYYNGKGEYGDDKGKVILANNANMGAAAELITEVEIARDAVSANPSQSIAAYSICGIPQATINSLAAKYNALNSTAKGYVNSSTVTTYTGAYGSEEGTVSYGDIMTRIVSMATSGSGSNRIVNAISNNSGAVIAIMTTIIAVTATGMFFFIRKRKHQ